MRCASGVCNVIMCVLVSKGHKDRSCACSFMSPLRRKKKSKSMRTKLTDSEKLSTTIPFMIKIF